MAKKKTSGVIKGNMTDTNAEDRHNIENLLTGYAEPDSIPIIADKDNPDVRWGASTMHGYAKGDTICQRYSKSYSEKTGKKTWRRN